MNWLERFREWAALPRTAQSLKYFSPDFRLRDPLVSLVRRARKRGQSCALLLYHVEEFSQMLNTYPDSTLVHIRSKIQQTFREILPIHFPEGDIIGARQFSQQDYGVFVRGSEEDHYLQIHYQALLLRDELERRLQYVLDPMRHESIKFQFGFYALDKGPLDTKEAVQFAYHYAMAIATKRLPKNFYYSRAELNDIILYEKINVLAQPVLNLRTGDIFGWEILTRGPQNSPFYFPAELFEFAHQSDLLYKMEYLVFKKALHEISRREIAEEVFINVTASTLRNPHFLEEVLDLMELFPSISPSQIIIEITEHHAIRDYQEMTDMMGRFREYGFRFAVDDAGSGYSTLQSISELIPDIIKLDRSLISNIDKAAAKQSLLKALLFFAENINCRVVAEGVERKEEAEVLFQHEVEMGQGYYFAQPAPLVHDGERFDQEKLKEMIKRHYQAARAPA